MSQSCNILVIVSQSCNIIMMMSIMRSGIFVHTRPSAVIFKIFIFLLLKTWLVHVFPQKHSK